MPVLVSVPLVVPMTPLMVVSPAPSTVSGRVLPLTPPESVMVPAVPVTVAPPAPSVMAPDQVLALATLRSAPAPPTPVPMRLAMGSAIDETAAVDLDRRAAGHARRAGGRAQGGIRLDADDARADRRGAGVGVRAAERQGAACRSWSGRACRCRRRGHRSRSSRCCCPRRSRVTAPATPLVTEPAPASEPIVSLKPLRSKVVLPLTVSALDAPTPLAMPRRTMPALTVVAPV